MQSFGPETPFWLRRGATGEVRVPWLTGSGFPSGGSWHNTLFDGSPSVGGDLRSPWSTRGHVCPQTALTIRGPHIPIRRSANRRPGASNSLSQLCPRLFPVGFASPSRDHSRPISVQGNGRNRQEEVLFDPPPPPPLGSWSSHNLALATSCTSNWNNRYAALLF